MDNKFEWFEFPDNSYWDETHSICVVENFLIWESIIDWFRWKCRMIYEFQIKWSKVLLKCLERKRYWDSYGNWKSKKWFIKDTNWDYVDYRIKEWKPQMSWLSNERYRELYDYEDGKLKLDLNKKEDKETLKLIKKLKKEHDMVVEDMEYDCEWHEMRDYIVARAYIIKHSLSEEEAKKQIEKLMKKADTMEAEEITLILRDGNIDRWDNYWVENTMKNLKSLQEAMGLNKEKQS